MRIVARLLNLVRGTLATWVRGREQRNPEAVYEAAIQERLAQYGKLREAAAGVLYMRSKLAGQLARESGALGDVKRQLDVALDRDDDTAALALIPRRNGLAGEVERLTAEMSDLTQEAEGAKQNLIAFQNEIVRLKEERVRMLARLANARARIRLQATLGGLAPDADIRALDEVRDHINRLVAETQIGRELGDEALEKRLSQIRDAADERTARAQLEELKRARRDRLVPLVLPDGARPEAVRVARAATH
jgi:phage shock protein A